MKLKGIFKGTAVALAFGLASTASADLTAKDAYEVMLRMQKFGFIASMETDSEGDPKIVSRVSDISKIRWIGGAYWSRISKSSSTGDPSGLRADHTHHFRPFGKWLT